MTTQLVYNFGFESLFKGLGDRFTPALREKLIALGLDVEALRPSYSKELWVRTVDTVVDELNVSGDLAKTRRQLGLSIAEGFTRSTFGRALTPAVRLVGVKRSLMRLPWHLSITNNFLRASVEDLGARSVRVEVNEPVPSAEFLCGVMEGIAGYAGAKSCEVGVSATEPLTRFTITWL